MCSLGWWQQQWAGSSMLHDDICSTADVQDTAWRHQIHDSDSWLHLLLALCLSVDMCQQPRAGCLWIWLPSSVDARGAAVPYCSMWSSCYGAQSVLYSVVSVVCALL